MPGLAHLEGAHPPADARERPRGGDPGGPPAARATTTARLSPEVIDAMWGTDMTAALAVEDGQVAVFVAVDHCSATCVGIHAAPHGTATRRSSRSARASPNTSAGLESDAAQGLAIRHDHGSQYMSRDFQKEIAWLGAMSSPAFVRAPEGNGCAERFIRTLKENLLWVRTFRTVEELHLALIEFSRTYNESWLIEAAPPSRPSPVPTRHDGHDADDHLIAIGCLKIQGQYICSHDAKQPCPPSSDAASDSRLRTESARSAFKRPSYSIRKTSTDFVSIAWG